MKVAISDKVFAHVVYHNSNTTFVVIEDRVELCKIGPYTFSHDCLSLLNLYQQLFEVNKCLLKTRIRSTYKNLAVERDRLTALIESIVSAH